MSMGSKVYGWNDMTTQHARRYTLEELLNPDQAVSFSSLSFLPSATRYNLLRHGRPRTTAERLVVKHKAKHAQVSRIIPQEIMEMMISEAHRLPYTRVPIAVPEIQRSTFAIGTSMDAQILASAQALQAVTGISDIVISRTELHVKLQKDQSASSASKIEHRRESFSQTKPRDVPLPVTAEQIPTSTSQQAHDGFASIVDEIGDGHDSKQLSVSIGTSEDEYRNKCQLRNKGTAKFPRPRWNNSATSDSSTMTACAPSYDLPRCSQAFASPTICVAPRSVRLHPWSTADEAAPAWNDFVPKGTLKHDLRDLGIIPARSATWYTKSSNALEQENMTSMILDELTWAETLAYVETWLSEVELDDSSISDYESSVHKEIALCKVADMQVPVSGVIAASRKPEECQSPLYLKAMSIFNDFS